MKIYKWHLTPHFRKPRIYKNNNKLPQFDNFPYQEFKAIKSQRWTCNNGVNEFCLFFYNINFSYFSLMAHWLFLPYTVRKKNGQCFSTVFLAIILFFLLSISVLFTNKQINRIRCLVEVSGIHIYLLGLFFICLICFMRQRGRTQFIAFLFEMSSNLSITIGSLKPIRGIWSGNSSQCGGACWFKHMVLKHSVEKIKFSNL